MMGAIISMAVATIATVLLMGWYLLGALALALLASFILAQLRRWSR